MPSERDKKSKKIRKIKKKKKGFTLIELLAVIIILGVLMIIAIPSVTEYIQSSRKNAYVTTATQYISGARNKINSAEIPMYDIEATYYLPASCISLEKGGDSPFGELQEAYIVVTYDGYGYDYYWTSRDETNTGILLTNEKYLNESRVQPGITSISTEVGVGDKEKIILINSCDGTDIIELEAVEMILVDGMLEENIPPSSLLYLTIKEDAVLDSIASKYVKSSTGIDFSVAPSNTNGNGLYIRSGTESSKYPIYYYRGAVVNNNVIFADFCWKIVRTTETGGIKLIYNGELNEGKCNNFENDTVIGSSKFNSSTRSLASFGYMYGETYYTTDNAINTVGMVFGNDVIYRNGMYTLVTEDGDNFTSESGWSTDRTTIGLKYHYTCFTTENTCSKAYYIYYSGSSSHIYYMPLTNGKNIDDALDDMLTNSTNTKSSIIKSYIDNWYVNNLQNYEIYLEDTIWCNDRTIYRKGGWDKDTNATNVLSFSVSNRTVPSFDCTNINDRFTVNASIGNGMLDNPIGLLTADEVTLAGNGTNGHSQNTYLYTAPFYLMTPYYFGGSNNGANASVVKGHSSSELGRLTNLLLDRDTGVRPSISLRPGIKFLSGGDGTADNPYKILED